MLVKTAIKHVSLPRIQIANFVPSSHIDCYFSLKIHISKLNIISKMLDVEILGLLCLIDPK